MLVALSGGPDSVALLRLLRELEAAGELWWPASLTSITGCATRRTLTSSSAARSRRQLGVPFRSDLVDVRARAERLHTSLEDAGRRARYELFERVATELEAAVVATGHTRDDQAETFLLRLLRGAGPRGPRRHSIRGAPAADAEARRWVVRPLLDVGRDELRTYLAALGQPFRDDESNRDLSIPRNRIRHELLPLLSRDFSPAITDVLAREAAIAQAGRGSFAT